MSKRIMVVDDSRIAQLQLQNALSDTEYQVAACCQTGEEALNLYEEVQPDLITMDIILPGMDGLETARTILTAHPEARILMVSSLAYDDAVDEARKIGAKGFIYKPLEREQLLQEMQQAFAGE